MLEIATSTSFFAQALEIPTPQAQVEQATEGEEVDTYTTVLHCQTVHSVTSSASVHVEAGEAQGPRQGEGVVAVEDWN